MSLLEIAIVGAVLVAMIAVGYALGARSRAPSGETDGARETGETREKERIDALVEVAKTEEPEAKEVGATRVGAKFDLHATEMARASSAAMKVAKPASPGGTNEDR
jgi:hypothetical protein